MEILFSIIVPIYKVENRHADSQRTNGRNRVAHVTRNHRADDTHNGYGNVGYYVW